MAWREKLALNMIIWASCGLMLFYIIGLGRILCPVVRVLSQGEVDGLNTLKNPFVVVYGDYYKINEIVKVCYKTMLLPHRWTPLLANNSFPI